MGFAPGSVVYETIDGGGLPGRVVASIEGGAQVLIRLDPALSPIAGIRALDRDGWRDRGYIVFRAESLTSCDHAQTQAA